MQTENEYLRFIMAIDICDPPWSQLYMILEKRKKTTHPTTFLRPKSYSGHCYIIPALWENSSTN